MVNANSQEIVTYRRLAISSVTNSDIVTRSQATKSNYEIAANNFTGYGQNREGLIEKDQDLGGAIMKYSDESLRIEVVLRIPRHPDAHSGRRNISLRFILLFDPTRAMQLSNDDICSSAMMSALTMF